MIIIIYTFKVRVLYFLYSYGKIITIIYIFMVRW